MRNRRRANWIAWIGLAMFVVPVAFAADQVYFTDHGLDADTGTILRANLDGSGLTLVVNASLAENPGALAIDSAAGELYWGASRDFSPMVKRANADGSSVEEIFGVGSKAGIGGVSLDLDAGKIYVTDPSDCNGCGRIVRANLDGTTAENWLTGLEFPVGVVVDPELGQIWWSTPGESSIRRANLDMTNEAVIVAGTNAHGLALDRIAGKLYWTDADVPSIERANLDGSDRENLLIPGLDRPEGIAVDHDGGKIYWVDRFSGKLRRAELDGARVEDLVVGLAEPTGIALLLGDDEDEDGDEDDDEDGDSRWILERPTRRTGLPLRTGQASVIPRRR